MGSGPQATHSRKKGHREARRSDKRSLPPHMVTASLYYVHANECKSLSPSGDPTFLCLTAESFHKGWGPRVMGNLVQGFRSEC